MAAINEAAASGGSADAILYTPQILTDEQKQRARENIGVATDFVVNATLNFGGTATLDKTFEQMSEAFTAGKKLMVRVRVGVETGYLTMSEYTGSDIIFTNMGIQSDKRFALVVRLTVNKHDAKYDITYLLAADGTQHMPQISMASDPTEIMQIATKKYVDDKEFILQSTTPGSSKKFKITVDDSGVLSAVEATE